MTDDELIDRTIDFEGGYQNDVEDDGNRNSAGVYVGTNAGITPADFERYYGRIPSAGDMRNLPLADVRTMYKMFYLNMWGQVPDQELKGELFDFGIVCGVPTAARALQEALHVQVDGNVGPVTIEKLTKVLATLSARMELYRQLTVIRIERYVDAILEKPAKRKYLIGWLVRALEVE